MGHRYFLPLRSGWPTPVGVHILVITGVPQRPCQEFRWGCYLTGTLQTLDEHYSMVMMFNALSEEVSSLKQGSGMNVANYQVHFSQQVQILLLKYPGRIQEEHMEKMKWNYFYNGLNPKYQHMLAHKVDGKHPTSYSDLLLVMWKLERWAEARNPRLPKTTTTGGSNVTWPQKLGNLFPSRKLKGNCTFMAGSPIVGSIETEGDLSVKLEGIVFRGGRPKNPEWNWWNRPADQLYHLFCQCSQAVPEEKTEIVSDVAVLTILWKISKDLSKVTRKTSLNTKEGTMKKGGCTPQKPVVTQPASPGEAPRA